MVLPEYSALIINVFLIALLIILIYKGYKKGFINQIIGLFTLALAALVAWIFYESFGKLFNIIPKTMVPFQTTSLSDFFYQKSNSMLWFIIIFVISIIIIKFITKILDLISKAPVLNFFNRILGVVFGFINFIIIVWLLILALSLPLFVNGDKVIERSFLKYQHEIVKIIDPFLEKPFGQLNSTQQVIRTPKQASTNDVESMQKWLLKNKLSLDEVVIFFKEIKDE